LLRCLSLRRGPDEGTRKDCAMNNDNYSAPPPPPRRDADTVRIVGWLVGLAMVLVALATVLVVALD
jgi:hypothetical protein